MKKVILALVFGLFFVAFSSAQTDTKKEEFTVNKEKSAAAYQCPMDCEKGKTYDKAGTCPVCKMDLKAQKGAKAKACCAGKGAKASCDGKAKKASCDGKAKASCDGKAKKASCDGKAKASCDGKAKASCHGKGANSPGAKK